MRKPTQIIKIETGVIDGSAVETVNARDLAENLEVKKDFSNWVKHQIKSLDLEENFDYFSFAQKGEREIGATTSIEYVLTVDTAKHIAMASRTDKGKLVRKYFIEMEKYAHYQMHKMFDDKELLLREVERKVLDKKMDHFFAIENAKISINTLDSFFDILSESAESKEWKNILFHSKDKVKKMVKDILYSFETLQDEAAKGDDILEEFKQSRKKHS